MSWRVNLWIVICSSRFHVYNIHSYIVYNTNIRRLYNMYIRIRYWLSIGYNLLGREIFAKFSPFSYFYFRICTISTVTLFHEQFVYNINKMEDEVKLDWELEKKRNAGVSRGNVEHWFLIFSREQYARRNESLIRTEV